MTTPKYNVTKFRPTQNQNQMIYSTQRAFFGKKKDVNASREEYLKKKAEQEAKEKEERQQKEAGKNEEEPESQEKPKAEEQKSEEESAQTDESGSEWTTEDTEKLKAYVKEQDDTIEALEENLEKHKKAVKELKEKLAYQFAENDNTVKRYRKQIDEAKVFAISKFAKELLDVRDSLALALEHTDLDKIEELEDVNEIREQLKNIVKGQDMTTKVMDKTLGKFNVTEMNPLGEKFDPNDHEAIFMMP